MTTKCDHHNRSESGLCQEEAQVHCMIYHLDLYLTTYIFCLKHWPEHQKSIKELGNWADFYIREDSQISLDVSRRFRD